MRGEHVCLQHEEYIQGWDFFKREGPVVRLPFRENDGEPSPKPGRPLAENPLLIVIWRRLYRTSICSKQGVDGFVKAEVHSDPVNVE